MRIVIIAFLTLITLVSCDRDKDPEPSKIVGRWIITASSGWLHVDGTPLKDYLLSTGRSETEAQNFVTELRSQVKVDDYNGTFEFKIDGTWSVESVYPNYSGTSTGTWKLSDDEKLLTLDYDIGTTMIADIVTLSEADIQLEIKNDDVQVPPNYDLGVPLQSFLSITLERI